MKAQYIKYSLLLLTVIILLAISIVLILNLTRQDTNKTIVGEGISDQEFTLSTPNIGNTNDKTLVYKVSDLSNDVEFNQNTNSVVFSNSTFKLHLSSSLGERGGLFDGMIDKTTLESDLGNLDRFQSTVDIQEMKSLLGENHSNYYFYTNMYGECAIDVSFCGVTEVRIDSTTQLEYDTHLTAYCNANENSVDECDEIMKNLQLVRITQ